MSETLHEIAHLVALGIEAAAILIVAYGSAEALYRILLAALKNAPTPVKRLIYFRFAQWLIGGLAFQLAADIVATTVTPTWSEIGHLAAIAAIRTFLTYFLDRDMQHVRGTEAEDMKALTELKAAQAAKS